MLINHPLTITRPARRLDLVAFTVPILKKALRERGLPVSGDKFELYTRLLQTGLEVTITFTPKEIHQMK